MPKHTHIVDAAINTIGENGWSNTNRAMIAKRAGVSIADFRAAFPTRASWIAAAYERTYERRVAQCAYAAKLVPAGNSDPSVNIKAAIQTVVDGDKVDPLFAAWLDLFFLARNDKALLRKLRRIQRRWDRKLRAGYATILPPGTSDGVLRFVITGVSFVGTTAVSNGLDIFDVRPPTIAALSEVLTYG